ncbi:hypothetical protein EGR_00015 [Echinococcus granulosus]|uniref:Uncharacterized protein n=1 Tax=Echinococcus granulosus TaxID=6210 RepID=W6UVT3_ECHGR|nr:hypothetical protein EGR_00015 [Echinococcus granulosus]EUB64746.1 hypothetical protein EGR_00015 [Echinococcus granulosus]
MKSSKIINNTNKSGHRMQSATHHASFETWMRINYLFFVSRILQRFLILTHSIRPRASRQICLNDNFMTSKHTAYKFVFKFFNYPLRRLKITWYVNSFLLGFKMGIVSNYKLGKQTNYFYVPKIQHFPPYKCRLKRFFVLKAIYGKHIGQVSCFRYFYESVVLEIRTLNVTKDRK